MVKANRRRIEEALQQSDRSAGQLAKDLHMGTTTAWRWVQAMVADGDAFVCATRLAPHGGPPIAIYRAGKKPQGFVVDAYVPSTELERTRRYREKQRETGDWDDVLARQRAYYWRTRKVARDPLTAAFFGASA